MIKNVFVGVCAAAICAAAQAGYKDGTYIGQGMGNAGNIDVAVQVSDGRITCVKVLGHGEEAMLLRAAEKKLSREILRKNTTKGVHGVTGATVSCQGILEAVDNALKKAQE